VESESPGVRVLVRSRSRSLSFEGDSNSGPYLDFCVFFAVCLTFVQFILQLKLYLYTIVHVLLQELTNLSQVIFKYTVMSNRDTISPRAGVGVML